MYIASIPGMKAICTRNLAGKAPIQTFKICHKCEPVVPMSQEVEAVIRCRYSGGKWGMQPICHKCRAAMLANPKKPTGPTRTRLPA